VSGNLVSVTGRLWCYTNGKCDVQLHVVHKSYN